MKRTRTDLETKVRRLTIRTAIAIAAVIIAGAITVTILYYYDPK